MRPGDRRRRSVARSPQPCAARSHAIGLAVGFGNFGQLHFDLSTCSSYARLSFGKRPSSQTWRTFLTNHAAWVWRQLIEATPWSSKPRHLLHDRDAVYGRDFDRRAERIGIDGITTPIHAPTANAIAERVIGTLRRECLDHLIVVDEQHLSAVLREFVSYYNQERPHRTLRLQTRKLRPRPMAGPIRSRQVLNGLHHVYERAA